MIMDYVSDDMIVCRCEEVTVGEIKQAIREGARDVVGVKRRVRAGMGLCQGRTCEKLVQQILASELSKAPSEVGTASPRPPVRPMTFGEIADGIVE
ncbi:MAG: (2Fe-2S)-binding protein [Lachnospira sp.]|nr:(2Fe-2S)-binding protein [Lachnospira sp.]